MKKQISLYFALYLMVSLFASCEKVVDIDTASSTQKMVLNAVPSAQKQLFVNFSHTHFFLDTINGHPVNDADIVISVNGSDCRPSYVRGCNYFFDYTLQEDDSLHITVKANGHTVTSHTTVPRMPDITNPIAQTNDTGTFHLMAVNFNINDHANYKDYYSITLRQRDSGSRYIPYLDIYDTIDITYNTMFLCNDKALIDTVMASMMAVGGYVPAVQLLASDEQFDGQVHNTTMMLILLRDTNEVIPYIHQYTLDVETVAPDRFRYLKDIGNATSMLQLITEPAAVYSNVNGALGIFAANARRTFPLITITGGSREAGESSKRKEDKGR